MQRCGTRRSCQPLCRISATPTYALLFHRKVAIRFSLYASTWGYGMLYLTRLRLATIHIRSWSFPLLPAAKCELGLQHHKKQSRFMPGGQCLRAKLTVALGAAIIFPAAKLRWLSAILPFGRHKDKQVPHNIFEKFRAQDHKIFEPQG